MALGKRPKTSCRQCQKCFSHHIPQWALYPSSFYKYLGVSPWPTRGSCVCSAGPRTPLALRPWKLNDPFLCLEFPFFCSAAFYFSCHGNEGLAWPRGTSELCESKQAKLLLLLPSAAPRPIWCPQPPGDDKSKCSVPLQGEKPRWKNNNFRKRRPAGCWCVKNL